MNPGFFNLPFARAAVFAAACILGCASTASSADERQHLKPRFTPGEVFRYQIELHTTAKTKTTGPITDPEGANALDESTNLLIRMEVLSVRKIPPGEDEEVRIRATYEKAAVVSNTDALDPQAYALEQQYSKLAGHSIEFTTEPDGSTRDVKGLEDLFSDPQAAARMTESLRSVGLATPLPAKGIVLGEKWTTTQPFEGKPLEGLVWKSEATYLRNEPCSAAADESKPAEDSAANSNATNSGESCAIILTRRELLNHAHGDPTPVDYVKHGLRTSGKWTGNGESLSAISLETGMAVSTTETSSEEMDFTVTSAAAHNRVHYSGEVHSRTEVRLIPAGKL
ncbi:MAG: hypothetical protein ACRD50_00835 [Candidatus Acidiferrales bacterium]